MSIGTRIQRGIFGTVLMLAQNRPVFTADYYSIDGSSFKVGSFIDWNDPTHTLFQTDGAKQVNPPSISVLFGGKPAITPNAAATRYASNRAASSWRFLHDGSGSVLLHVLSIANVAAFQAISTTVRNNAAATGHNFYMNSASSAPRTLTRNGSSTVLIGASAAAGFNVGTYSMQVFCAGVEASQYTKSARTSVTYTPPPSQGDPDRTFSLFNGDTTVSDYWFQGSWRCLVAAPFMGAAEMLALFSWIQQDTGITP